MAIISEYKCVLKNVDAKLIRKASDTPISESECINVIIDEMKNIGIDIFRCQYWITFTNDERNYYYTTFYKGNLRMVLPVSPNLAILCHELSHVITQQGKPHGIEFCTNYSKLMKKYLKKII